MNFRDERRSNQTHESKNDPKALLAREGKGTEAKLSYSENLLMENGNGLIVDSRVWEGTGTAERYAALDMLQHVPGSGRVTVGGDKGYDTAARKIAAKATPQPEITEEGEKSARATQFFSGLLGFRFREQMQRDRFGRLGYFWFGDDSSFSRWFLAFLFAH